MPCLWNILRERLFDIDVTKAPPSLVVVTFRSREKPGTGFRVYSIGVGDGLKGYVLSYFDEARETENVLSVAYYPGDAIADAAREYSERYPQLKLLWDCEWKISEMVLHLNGEEKEEDEEEESEDKEEEKEESKQAKPSAGSEVVSVVSNEAPLEPVFTNIMDIVKDEEERLKQLWVKYEIKKGLALGIFTMFLLGIGALAKILKAING